MDNLELKLKQHQQGRKVEIDQGETNQIIYFIMSSRKDTKGNPNFFDYLVKEYKKYDVSDLLDEFDYYYNH